MLALRSTATKHLISAYRLPAATHHLISNKIGCGIRCLSTNEEGVVIGSVKFYNVGKAYGFITPEGTDTDIFVHRTHINGATDDDIKNPILISGEKVQFRKEVDENNKEFATDVKFEDGSIIPLYRPDFVERRTKTIKSRLGFEVYDILSGGGDEELVAQKIAGAYTSARDNINDASDRQRAAQDTPTIED